MIYKIKELSGEPLDFDFYIKPGSFEKITEDFTVLGEGIHCKGKISLGNTIVTIEGSYIADWRKECDHCLKINQFHSGGSFQLELHPVEEYIEESEESTELFTESPDVDFYSNDEVNLSLHLEDQFLLDLPGIIKCSDECKGLCAGCGADLNTDVCSCSASNGTSPFSVLNKYKI